MSLIASLAARNANDMDSN